MSWASAFVALWISHLVGDYLIQTDWQAVHKAGGLSRDAMARRALLSHVLTYTASFVPALIWIGGDVGAVAAIGLGLLIGVPHALVDDGRPVRWWLRHVKGAPRAVDAMVAQGVDQSMHAVALFAVALLASAWA